MGIQHGGTNHRAQWLAYYTIHAEARRGHLWQLSKNTPKPSHWNTMPKTNLHRHSQCFDFTSAYQSDTQRQKGEEVTNWLMHSSSLPLQIFTSAAQLTKEGVGRHNSSSVWWDCCQNHFTPRHVQMRGGGGIWVVIYCSSEVGTEQATFDR